MGTTGPARLFAVLTSAALLAAGTRAHGATNPITTCRTTSDATKIARDGRTWAEPAAKAEAMLGEAQDRISVADQAIKMLAAVDPGNADTPQSALAAYCAAAGEAFRLGRTGNPYQARSLLEDALRHAEAAGSAPLMALSAYRLALVSGDGSSGGQSGGAGRGLRRSVARRAP